MFGNILKILFSYKFFTFSQLPKKKLFHKIYHHPHISTHRKSTNTHKKSTTIHIKPTNTQHRNHQNATTHTTTKKKKKKLEIKERKQIGDKIDLEEEIDQRVVDDEIDSEEEMIWPRGGWDRSSGGRLHVARSWWHVWGWGAISPACLVARSRRLALSLSLSLCVSESENGVKWK